MKKNRNAFFESSGYGNINPGMNPNMMQPNMMNPNMMQPGQISSNANFYAGPPLNPNVNTGGMASVPADIDSRLAKIERQINRLETRINKLEGDTGGVIYPENDYNYSNSMYMV